VTPHRYGRLAAAGHSFKKSGIVTNGEESAMHGALEGYEISTETGRLDVDLIHDFLATESYWAQGVPRTVVDKAIANSLCFGVYAGTAQVGFGRVVTDKATFALVADLFILKEHRGKGLSKWLMQSIVDHAELHGLRRLLLLTSDAHGLYSQFGFKPLGAPLRFMELHHGNIYHTPPR
jgi:N-acetylglutamate synthase-like GNAT family acetyltransferase